MWNYSFIVPSVLVLITLIVFYFARPRLPLRINRTFLGILLLELLVLLSDILASRADEEFARHSPALLYALNTVYFVLLLLRSFWFFRFTADVTFTDQLPHPRWRMLSLLPFCAAALVCATSFKTGAVFRITPEGYIPGPFYCLIYVHMLFYLALSLGLVFARRTHMRRNDRIGALAFNLVMLAGIAARYMFPQVLVMYTFCLVSILIMFLTFLNPDLYVTALGPAYSMRGFKAMLRELSGRKDYAVLGFTLRNYSFERSILGGDQMDAAIARINQYLADAFPRCVVFYLRSGRFALIIPASMSAQAARAQILDRFQRPWQMADSELMLDISFAYLRPQQGLDTADRMVNNLVIALEAAATDAQYSTGAIDPLRIQKLDEQVDVLHSLEVALEEDAVEVFFQPVFTADTRRPAAAEALARIRDPNGQLIPPGLFIPLAERRGLINRLGEQVFEKTCAFIRDNGLKRLGLGWINVNLSPIQCMQQDLARRLSAIMARYGVGVEQIRLELTEQSIVDYALLERQILALKELGFLFVLDDYGSGYSNLTRVRRYPFVNIKLDMEVVWDYFRDRDSLLPTIIDGFKKMGFSITAEGIETREMADVLTGIGADYLQGYLFSRPLPMEEFLEKYGK